MLKFDLSQLRILKVRGLSDAAIGRRFGCSRETIFNYRRKLGIETIKWRQGVRALRLAEERLRNATLDRLWQRVSLDQKIALLTRSDGQMKPNSEL